jgi:membrane fusion protein (multidrug efflux system)
MHKKAWMAGGAVVLLLAAGAGVALWPRTGGAASGEAGGAKAPAVLEFSAREVVQPALASVPIVVEFSGPLVAPQTAVLRAKAAGTLLALTVAEGDRVKAGQVVGRIDGAELDTRLAERRAQVESARAQLAQAERTHASNQRLSDQGFISPIALDGSRSALDTARAQLRAAEASLQTTQVAGRETVLLAPIAGIVHKRHVLPGEKVASEQQVLTLVDLAALELAGSVATHEVSLLEPGMPVAVRVEGHARDVTGRLARIAPAAEPGTRSIGVTVALPNPKESFRAGQYAVGRVELADPARRLTLPAGAVAGSPGAQQVWVIDGGALLRRAVTTGRRDDREGRVEIVAGLDARAQVLAGPYDNLREGAKAVVVARSAPVASASASSPVVR